MFEVRQCRGPVCGTTPRSSRLSVDTSKLMVPTLPLTRFIPFLVAVPFLTGGEQLRATDSTAKATESRQSGRIAGKVEVSTALVSRRPRFRIYADAGRGAVPPAAQGEDLGRELRNVVVYLVADAEPESSIRLAKDEQGTVDMAQRNERFEPHVLPVVQGTRVAFPNQDDVYHNVFSLSSARAFDLGRYPKGEAKSVHFRKPGLVQVFCHIHSDMSGIVLVLPNEFFAAPGATGEYGIERVPPGEYTIVGWHERAKPVTRRIRVVAGETTTINFSLPLQATEAGGQP